MANFSQFAMFIFIALFMMMTIASSKEPEPAFMQNKKRGERAEKAKERAQKKRELKDKMPEKEQMHKEMEDMHTWWCKGQAAASASSHEEDRSATTLCTTWYKYQKERQSALLNGEKPPIPSEDEKPDMDDVHAMHIAWCKHAGHEDFGPCLMWSQSPMMNKEEL